MRSYLPRLELGSPSPLCFFPRRVCPRGCGEPTPLLDHPDRKTFHDYVVYQQINHNARFLDQHGQIVSDTARNYGIPLLHYAFAHGGGPF